MGQVMTQWMRGAAVGVAGVLMGLMLAACQPGRLPGAAPSATPINQAEGEPLAFSVFDGSTHASFVGGGGGPDDGMRLLSIRSQADWDAVLFPAPLMGRPQVFSPPESLYARHQILLLSQTIGHFPAPDTYVVDSVMLAQGRVTVRYRYQARPASSAQFGAILGIVIPRADYTEAMFVQNGAEIGVLKLAGTP